MLPVSSAPLTASARCLTSSRAKTCRGFLLPRRFTKKRPRLRGRKFDHHTQRPPNTSGDILAPGATAGFLFKRSG
jgi:hypothetical protein